MLTPGAEVPKKLLEIPSFPPIAARILRALGNENVDIGEVLELVRAEPAVSAHLLLQANSPIYGFPSRIESLRQALVLLGARRIRAVTARVAAAGYVRAAMRTKELRRCWRHTLACAVLAEHLARACSLDAEDGYTAGLLHDIGRLGLLVAYPGEYVQTLRDAALKSVDVLDYERQRFGMHHAEVGRWLVEQWNLPTEFQVIAGRHHDPPDGREPDLLSTVHLACRLADSLGFDVVRPLQPVTPAEVLASLPPEARSRISGDPEELRQLVEGSIEPLETPSGEELPPLAPALNSEINEPVALFEAQSKKPVAPDVPAASRNVTLLVSAAILLAALVVALLLR